MLTIYIGAHRGLTTRSRQQITLKEGVLAPFAASASLFGLYLLIKYLPNFSIQTLIDVYFWLLGSYAIGGALVPIARQISGPAGKPSLVFNPPEGWLLDDAGESLTRVEVAPSDIVAVAAALGLATAELLGHHTNFTLNNMVRGGRNSMVWGAVREGDGRREGWQYMGDGITDHAFTAPCATRHPHTHVLPCLPLLPPPSHTHKPPGRGPTLN